MSARPQIDNDGESVVLAPDDPVFRAPNVLMLSMNSELRITEVFGDVGRFGIDRAGAKGRSVLDFIAPEEHHRIISSFITLQAAREAFPLKEAAWLTIDLALATAHGERLAASVSVHPVDEDLVAMVRIEPTPNIRHESLRRLAESRSLVRQLEAAGELVSTPRCLSGFVTFPPQEQVVWPHDQIPARLVAEDVWRPMLDGGVRVRHLDELPPEVAALAEASHMRSVWVDPLVGPDEGRCLGIMLTWSQYVGLDAIAGVDRLLDEARWIATLAVSQHDTVRRLEYMATMDNLTDIPNRAGLERHLRELGDEEVSVLYLDLDRFKAVNDELGHSAGDEVLREVARRLSDTVADAGFVARLGGDEFCVVIPGTSETAPLARRIEVALTRPIPSVDDVVIGASIGESRSGVASDAWRLLRDADEGMLARKSSRVATRFRSVRLPTPEAPEVSVTTEKFLKG